MSPGCSSLHTDTARSPHARSGCGCLSLHLLVAVAFGIWIARSSDPVWPALWAPLLIADMPVSLILTYVHGDWGALHLSPNPSSPANDVSRYWVPLGLHAILGSCWWGALAVWFGKLVSHGSSAKPPD